MSLEVQDNTLAIPMTCMGNTNCADMEKVKKIKVRYSSLVCCYAKYVTHLREISWSPARN